MGLWRSMLLLNAPHLWTASHNKDALKLVRCILCHSELTWGMWLLWENWKIGTSYTILTVSQCSAVKNLPGMQEMQVQSLGQEEPLEEGMATTPVFLSGEFHEQGSLLGVAKSQAQLKWLSMHARIPYLSISTSFFSEAWKSWLY